MPRKAPQPALPTPQAGTLTDSILRLEVGDEYAAVRYLNPESDKLDHDSISGYKTRMNNTVSGVAARISRATGRKYQTEGAVYCTTRNRLYATIIVTRVE